MRSRTALTGEMKNGKSRHQVPFLSPYAGVKETRYALLQAKLGSLEGN